MQVFVVVSLARRSSVQRNTQLFPRRQGRVR
jgi:hypothetical protein